MDTTTDGRKLRGERSRRAVLEEAVQEASVRGLGGLSLGGLAERAPVRKSGIAGLFGSKEGLQLASVRYAAELFTEAVIVPAREAERGLPRLWALVNAWLEYSRRRVFDGGCFFRSVGSEYDALEGPVRDAIAGVLRTWDDYLRREVRRAVERGHLREDTEPEHVVFLITAMLAGANDRSLLFDDDSVYERALSGVRTMLLAHGADPDLLGEGAPARP